MSHSFCTFIALCAAFDDVESQVYKRAQSQSVRIPGE